MTQCADKYDVREYVKLKGLQRILNDCYAVYDSPEEIHYESLPSKLVLKTTNGSGTNIFIDDKIDVDVDKASKQLFEWLRPIKKPNGREWAYENIKPRIICEKYLENNENGEKGDLVDYKFFCFNGVPKMIQVDVERYTNHKRNMYDVKWNPFNIEYLYPKAEYSVSRPANIDEMVDIAATLSMDFPFVRVDLYNLEGKIVFGELTFYPEAGTGLFTPDEFDKKVGEWFILPEVHATTTD